MALPEQKPAWYHQIRWRLTLSYGLVIFFALVIAKFLFLSSTTMLAYYQNPDVELAQTYLVGIQQIFLNELRAFPFMLLIGHALSRRFSVRLEDLANVVHSWTNGQFDVRIQDDSADEIGVLTRQLQVMADQLQKTAETEQALAAARERDRFARDLHDTVKQQVFAMQMELTAVRNLLATDPEAAAGLLNDAIGHSRQAQQDLNSLIGQAPPGGLDHKTLGVALSEYVAANGSDGG